MNTIPNEKILYLWQRIKKVNNWKITAHRNLFFHRPGIVIADLNKSNSEDSKDAGYEKYVQETYGVMEVSDSNGNKAFNATRDALLDYIELPLWVPSSLGGLLVTSGKKLERKDLAQLQEEVLDGSGFYVTSKDSTRLAAIYRGNILKERDSTQSSDQKQSEASIIREIFEDILVKLEKANGNLKDRIQLFILEDQEVRKEYGKFGNYKPQKVIIAVSKSVEPEQGDMRGTGGVILAVSFVLIFD